MFNQLTDDQFKKFKDLIYKESGMTFNDINRPILESRLKMQLKKAELDNIDEYYRRVTANSNEMKVLLDAVTTNLTSFFRNRVHFQGFETGVLDAIRKTRKDKRIRIWSAGCSTGEEPYSVAMVLKDKMPDWKIEIVASDISFNVLMKAREGFYPTAKVTGIPPTYLQRFTNQVKDGYVMKDELKKLITFDYHNLKNVPIYKNFDVVFCRNVIIYFDAAAQEHVVNTIYNAMNPDSYFFIGHSESLFGMNTKFEFIKFGEACLYKKQ
ncbi:MAG: protein-glutamate O-methyltransferase CheR [Spirochaetales bacterium]|nr:protein-glutamate O-methyltransferase CheR [Spirochaetales bacterium]